MTSDLYRIVTKTVYSTLDGENALYNNELANTTR